MYVREFGFIRDSNASRRYTGSSLTRKTLRRSHWISGHKPQLIKNGRRIECNTANYVPFVVPGLSTSSSSSSTTKSPTSSSQEAVTLTQHPASTGSESVSDGVRGTSSHGPAETENPNKMMTTKEYGETRCVICQNGYRSSGTVW